MLWFEVKGPLYKTLKIYLARLLYVSFSSCSRFSYRAHREFCRRLECDRILFHLTTSHHIPQIVSCYLASTV